MRFPSRSVRPASLLNVSNVFKMRYLGLIEFLCIVSRLLGTHSILFTFQRLTGSYLFYFFILDMKDTPTDFKTPSFPSYLFTVLSFPGSQCNVTRSFTQHSLTLVLFSVSLMILDKAPLYSHPQGWWLSLTAETAESEKLPECPGGS